MLRIEASILHLLLIIYEISEAKGSVSFLFLVIVLNKLDVSDSWGFTVPSLEEHILRLHSVIPVQSHIDGKEH